MFDFRYHALSLVAVFLALAIGLVLGVAIGDSGLVSQRRAGPARSLRGDVREAHARRATTARAAEPSATRFERPTYPASSAGGWRASASR